MELYRWNIGLATGENLVENEEVKEELRISKWRYKKLQLLKYDKELASKNKQTRDPRDRLRQMNVMGKLVILAT